MARREEVLGRAVFSVEGRTFTWRDVVVAARIWSDWTDAEQRARETIALRGEFGGAAAADEVAEAQDRFRYDRNLLAADELEAWLGNWGISVQEWLEQVEGAVHRGRGSQAPAEAGTPDPAELEAATWAEAVCSGELERLARKLAARCAVFEGTPPAELTEAALSRMDEVHRSFCEAAATEGALERRLADEQLELTRIDGRYLAHRDEDVVREAALGVREEGRGLEDMAKLAEARFEPAARFYLADLDPEVKTRVLATSPGELCGPFPSGEEYWLLEVGARTPPSLDDPELRDRVAADLVERAVEKEILGSVRWHNVPER